MGRRAAAAHPRESEARKSAILNAAFDCIITMDAEGRIVEVNPAAERTFGYRASEMVGGDLAELIIPPHLREAHRRGLARYVSEGATRMLGHPVELPAMRSDGSEFPVEIAITRPYLPGPPQFTGFLRDVTDRRRDELALRSLADEQAALRRVATAVASDVAQPELFAVVTEEVGRLLGAHTANLVRFDPDGGACVAGAWGAGAAPVPVGTTIALEGGGDGEVAATRRIQAPISLGGRPWGAVLVSAAPGAPFPPGAEQRIADFAELVALALANAEAREQLAASRARIVKAGDEERRRIERNLHDGAQQRLVAVSLMLRLCESKLRKGDADALGVLVRANGELAEAVQELRELARGIHPAVLTDHGLLPALEMLAGRASVPVELTAELDGRLPQPVEAAAYYLVSEALTNASKHAGDCSVRVEVRRENGAAFVEVADDGRGGAAPGGGSGLRGLEDRIEALGGRLEVESPEGTGTALRARIPCS